ncbi:MAG: RNase adapter RapZ [Armatimonadetes bacterium]|nr:RNase adapter RapZ [Armatimonadota bacterium]NIO76155.1 RNase adapter RapZ [Armatimonadota bacterium]NIO98851.1 RNase adapter RapZ [Armatimonadota bacterium]
MEEKFAGHGRTRLVIVTGLSGAGKSEVIRCFEDLGFYCVDNLPPALLVRFAELCERSARPIPNAVLVTDVRGGDFFDDLEAALSELRGAGFDYRILFLEAAEEVLVSRFKEVRRPHPLMSKHRSLLECLREERARLQDLRGRADKVIDTSMLKPQELKEEVASIFPDTPESEGMLVNIISFGFKYGLPADADMVFDARFLPNPHYVEGLRELPGTDIRVSEFVLGQPETQEFLPRVESLLESTLPKHREEGRPILTIAIGCTGGRHRAVVLAQALTSSLRSQGHRAFVEHRDIDK